MSIQDHGQINSDLCAHCGDQFPIGQICSTCAVVLSGLRPPVIYPLADGIGSVELLDHMGTDLTIVNAARVSYQKESRELSPRDKKLINFCFNHRHNSPFEHVMFTFRVKAPLFVVRQWQRHRFASYNEQSGRWSEFSPEFYVPDDPEVSGAIREWSKEAFDLYESMLAHGVAKERARLVLPLNLYTTFWFTVNSWSVLNFMSLRHHEDAQEEIQAYGQAVETMFARLLPATHEAFLANGRRTP